MEMDDPTKVQRAIHRGLDLGLTHVDTAEMYGSGAVERLVGEALVGRRGEVFLASKVLPHNASREGTRRACEQSLKRLRTDHLDLYMLHWPGAIPLAETIEAFEQLVQAGKIRYWGVSNFDVGDLEQALAIAGKGRIACNQVLYHLQERAIEHALIPFCEAHEVPIVAYSPFGSGDFPDSDSRAGRELNAIAKARGVTARQVALAFLLREPHIFAIPKASRPEHVEDNARAAALTLSPEEQLRLETAFPLGMRPASLPML
ncbi:Hypothetical protein CAP_3076 [Chondromyces apiculatus DSM 436]|uniref:NADP-dependent oxidoreductase domain-containing protein n=2 Tax=Chondromyces apiculatus TaxID=51 RepID=A0A017T8G4_9BACT|nr:Hypothetical protein CAP_3076 [Chondromyces apiculatus DSM 436]